MIKPCFHYVFCFIAIFCLSGCKQVLIKKTDCIGNFFGELEARHYDIPLIIDAKPFVEWYRAVSDPVATDSLVYYSSCSYENIVVFYEGEMERYGWNQIAIMKNQEAVLVFEKPHKCAFISIRPRENNVFVYVFVAPKEDEFEK